MISTWKTLILSAALVCLSVLPAAAEINQTEFNQAMETFLSSEAGQESVGAAMQKYVERMRSRAAKEQQQRQAAAQEQQFDNPIAVKLTENDMTKGPANAKVTIVEFSEFECPYCRRGADTMYEVLKAYPNDVRLVFKHLPLSFHKNAEPASRAALAAGKQGKFWEMHDHLFENQRSLGEKLYMEQAEKMGLDMTQFKSDYNSAALKKQIQEDLKEAERVGVRGTPGFLINGVLVSGARPADDFKQIIDRWLAKK